MKRKTTTVKQVLAGLTALLFLTTPGITQPAGGFIHRYIHSMLERDWEYKMISSGPNFPSINLREKHRGDLCILIHYGLPLDSIRSYFEWSEKEMSNRLDELLKEEVIRRDSLHGYLPAITIMSLGDVARHLYVPESLVVEASKLIIAQLPEIKRQYANIAAFTHIPFSSASLLILSDVMLDNWQINNIEQQFLKAQRPLRNGKRYYYAIMEKVRWQPTESFGIYGNEYHTYGPFTVGVYGNRRVGNNSNFIALTLPQLKQRFEETGPDNLEDFKQMLLENLVRFVKDADYAFPEAYRTGFKSIGLMDGGKVGVPVLDAEEEKKLTKMASLLTDKLVALFQRYQADLDQFYKTSPYVREISFEEYFIWWYHLFYTEVTDMLVASGHIVIPSTGIVTYLIVP